MRSDSCFKNKEFTFFIICFLEFVFLFVVKANTFMWYLISILLPTNKLKEIMLSNLIISVLLLYEF